MINQKKFNILENECSKCSKCSLSSTRNNVVFGRGNPSSKLFVIGEGPGQQEDEQGLAFVGRAGMLLDKMLAAIKLDRKNVYISNIINYRPPDNRRPTE